MADSSGWITLKKMVQEILFETDADQGNYKKYMHHVINGVRDLNMYHFDNVKTAKLIANDIGAVDMPSDYVEFRALAIQDGGKMWTLTREDNLIRTTTLDGGDETLDNDIGEGVSIDTGRNYTYRTKGGKNDFYFTVDTRNDRFIIRGLPGTTRTFFLMYISSGVDLNEGNATQIPAKIKQPLKWWVMYQNEMMSRTGNKNNAILYQREYEREVSKLRFSELPTADEIRDIIYSTYEIMRR